MKKYKSLYKEEKQRHEEALQRYQEDHMDEMEIINLHKRCNKKAKKVSQAKKALPKLDGPKKVSRLIDDPSEEEQKPKKGDGKKTTTKAGKKVKKTAQPKKVPKIPEFVDTDSDDSDEEQEPVAEQLQKALKTAEFVDTGTVDEQGRQPKEAGKISECSDHEQGPVVNYQRCIVMYSTEN